MTEKYQGKSKLKCIEKKKVEHLSNDYILGVLGLAT
jgi:hypothetical protein